MMEAMDRAFGFRKTLRDLSRLQAMNVPQHHHLSLALLQLGEGRRQLSRAPGSILEALLAEWLGQLAEGRGPPTPKMVDRNVSRDPRKPSRERNRALLKATDHRDQLQEDLLSYVLSLILIGNH